MIKTAHVQGETPRAVAKKLAQAIGADMAFTLVFASSLIDARALARALEDEFEGPVLGCTTAGEISSHGFSRGGVVAMGFSSAWDVGWRVITDLVHAPFSAGADALAGAATDLGTTLQDAERDGGYVAMLLVDGLSNQEERVAASLANIAPRLQIVGGSASDDGRYQSTHVFVDGDALSDAALVLLLRPPIGFAVLKSEPSEVSDDKHVVTALSGDGRRVFELNGKPALLEYARAVGADPATFSLAEWCRYPFAVMIGHVPYLRSVRARQGNTLEFACALDEGVVLRVARPGDLVASTRAAFDRARAEVGEISGVIAFNCLGRYHAAELDGATGALGEVFGAYPIAGFNTYGEQINSLHVNNTLTGLVFGARAGAGRA